MNTMESYPTNVINNLPLDVITGQTRNRQGIAEILLKVEQNIIDKHDHGT
jgi:hypothetical protein